MGITAIDERKYGELLARTLPRVVENDSEFDRLVAALEELDFAKRELSPEEIELQKLLGRLVQEYDDRNYNLPASSPREVLVFLMEDRGLRQRDLVPVLGASSAVSDLVNGKRSISKAQARKLAEFFRVPADLFI
jgi:HTH-type transcriptional regulator / antitoxin HigA